jgi:hypothetical protein
MEDADGFQKDLLEIIINLQLKGEDVKLRREVFRLLVVTFILSHVLNVAEGRKHSALSMMKSYEPDAYLPKHTSPRLVNGQLKYFFYQLHEHIRNSVLDRLQKIFRSSGDRWLAASIAVIGVCMAQEEMQKLTHLVQNTKAASENLDHSTCQVQADVECRDIDSFAQSIFGIFQRKNCPHDPVKNAGYDWNKEDNRFAREVMQLVQENSELGVLIDLG